MTSAIATWWTGLSEREKWLVGIAAALAALVIGWLLIALPLQAALSNARTAHGLAVDRHAAVHARVEAVERLSATAAARPAGSSSTAALDLAIAQAAAERGFALSRNDPQGNDAVALAIASARSSALLGWIVELEESGITASEVTIRPNADGTVALTATLRRAR
jgi:general secretion pathway protein M